MCGHGAAWCGGVALYGRSRPDESLWTAFHFREGWGRWRWRWTGGVEVEWGCSGGGGGGVRCVEVEASGAN